MNNSCLIKIYQGARPWVNRIYHGVKLQVILVITSRLGLKSNRDEKNIFREDESGAGLLRLPVYVYLLK